MTILFAMKEIEATVFSAAEEADVLHDRRRCGKSVSGDSITLSLSLQPLITNADRRRR